MAYVFTLNVTPSTGAVNMFNLKTALKAQGWTVPRSSDGTTYNSTGDQITTGASGAGGMANNSAWFVIQAPAGGRQLCIQRATANTTWWVRYSFSAGFTGGSPAATVAPTATDQQNLAGTSVTGIAIFPTDNTYRTQTIVDSASPYGWLQFTYAVGGGIITSIFMMDPITSISSDADPYVFICNASAGLPTMPGNNGNVQQSAFSRPDSTIPASGILGGYLKKGLAGEGFVSLSIMYYYAFINGSTVTNYIPFTLGTDPNNGKDDIFPALYGRSSNSTVPIGYKGMSTLLQWTAVSRTTGDLLSISTTGDRFVMQGCLVCPWNNTVPTL